MECPECGDEMYITGSGDYKKIEWCNYKCPSCGKEVIEEPDWDSLPNGHDDKD